MSEVQYGQHQQALSVATNQEMSIIMFLARQGRTNYEYILLGQNRGPIICTIASGTVSK